MRKAQQQQSIAFREEGSQPRLVRVSGRKHWYIEGFRDGKRFRETTKTEDTSEAQARLEEAIKEVGRPRQILTHDILDKYVEYRTPRIASPETLAYRVKPLKRFFWLRMPSYINWEKCREYTARRQRSGVKASTIRAELSLLGSAMRFAVKQGWIEREPAIELPPGAQPKERWLTRAEAALLLKACASHHLRLFVQIALYTGARRGAILELTWDQVDLDSRFISFNPPGRAQTKKVRARVPINDELYEALTEAKKRVTSEYVVEWGGKRVLKINKAFGTAAAKAGLKDVTPHTLRHTAATWMVQAGAELHRVAGMLGHGDIRTTMKIYVKHDPNLFVEAARFLNLNTGASRSNPIQEPEKADNAA